MAEALFPLAPALLGMGKPRIGTRKRGWVLDRRGLRRALREEPLASRAEVGRAVEARPRTRADCVDGPRPCPWVACRHHLGLEATPTGGLQFTWPGAELEDLPETCALDVAERGGLTLEATGALLNVTRERVRQIEAGALVQLRRRAGWLRSSLSGDQEPCQP